MYVGAWLWYENGVMHYLSGRRNRNSQYPNGTAAIDRMEESKVFFCNKGIAHWGQPDTELRKKQTKENEASVNVACASLLSI